MRRLTLILGTLHALILTSLAGGAHAQSTPARTLDAQDRIILGLAGHPPGGTETTGVIAQFTALHVWLTQPGRTPDWKVPTRILATAWYDPQRNGYDPIRRVTFNGQALTLNPPSNPSPQLRTHYALKQAGTPDTEQWLNWYADFSRTAYPEYVALDSTYGRPEHGLGFPQPYRLTVPATLNAGRAPWRYEIAPIDPAQPLAEYATVTTYPSRTRENQLYVADSTARPGTVLRDIPADGTLVGQGGWTPGAQPGYAAVSACNTRRVGFAAGAGTAWVLFKACSVVVNAVTFNVR